MMAPPDPVVFDLDGTLIDSRDAIVATVEHACQALHIPSPSRKAILDGVGLPLATMFERLFCNEPSGRRSELVEAYKTSWLAFADPLLRPYAGALELVHSLHREGRSVGIATSKSRRGLDRVLDRYAMRDLIGGHRSVDEARAPKPAPHMLIDLLADLDGDADRAVMIGDSSYDMGMARAAGVRAIGVTWGVHDAERLLEAGADEIVTSVDALAVRLGVL